MAYLCGKWRWHDIVPCSSPVNTYRRFKISFKFDGLSCIGFQSVEYYDGTRSIVYMKDDTTNYSVVNSSYDNISEMWVFTFYRGQEVDFGAIPQEIDDDFYNFFVANADPLDTIADKLQYIAENEPKVYDAGYNSGYKVGFEEGKAGDGYGEGFEDGKQKGYTEGYSTGKQDGYVEGKQAEYDAFWNMIQDHGNRTDYGQAFRNWRSRTEYLRPKYKVVPTASTSAMNTFYNCEGLKKVEAEYFDFSKKPRGAYQGSGWYHTFTTCGELEEIEDIGIMPDTDLTNTFAHCPNLKKVAMIRVDVNTVISSGIFENCKSLESVTFDGEIGYGMNLKWSTKLTRASIENIINHLSDNGSGKTLTLSKAAVDEAFRGISAGDFTTIVPGSSSLDWFNLTHGATVYKQWTITFV